MCKVLTHPNFDRPKVINPVSRGKKKGCISFTVARSKLQASRIRASIAAKESWLTRFNRLEAEVQAGPLREQYATLSRVATDIMRLHLRAQDLYTQAVEEHHSLMQRLSNAPKQGGCHE